MSTTTSDGFVDSDGLGPLHYAGMVAAIVTGIVHLRLGIGFAPSGLGLSFLFAGVVFVLAVFAVAANYRRRLVYQLGIPFTVGQIVLWYLLNFAGGDKTFPADVGTLGAIDKVAQLLLVIVLGLLLREE